MIGVPAWPPGVGGEERPLSSEYGTHKTVTAKFWPWLSGQSPPKLLKVCPLLSEAVLCTRTTLEDLIAANIPDKYCVGPSIRPIPSDVVLQRLK